MNWLLALLGTTSGAAIVAVVLLALAYRKLSDKLWTVQVSATEAAANLDVSLRLNKGIMETLKQRKKYVAILEKAVVRLSGPDKLADLLNELYGTVPAAKGTEPAGGS